MESRWLRPRTVSYPLYRPRSSWEASRVASKGSSVVEGMLDPQDPDVCPACSVTICVREDGAGG